VSDASPTGSAAPATQSDHQRDSGYLHLVGLGALIGLPAALLAAGFLALVHQVEHWLWTDLPRDLGASHPPWYLVITLPVVGAAVAFAARRRLPGDGGHPPLEGIGGAKPTPIAHGPGIALAAIGTLGFGAVLGPEAPLIALGSVAGLITAKLGNVGERERAVLGSAGSFAAVSALFGGPIVGGLMMVEGGLSLGEALLPMLLPGFVAAAIGYVLFVGLGSWGGLSSQGLTEPGLPPYNGTHIRDLLLAIAVGVIAALVIAGVRVLARTIDADGLRDLGMPALLLCGGLTVGLLAQTADWLGADSQDVLFSGQASVPALVTQGTTGIVLLLLVAKALTYAISLGCGYRGGPIFPAIYLGIAVATLPVVWFGASPTLAVAIGTAAGMSATSRLVLTPIVFAALLAGSHGLDAVPAAVLAAVAAWLTTTALDRRWQGAERHSTP
jgi:H+/Cl- antiporter ClcA